jgi:hypothetical protein
MQLGTACLSFKRPRFEPIHKFTEHKRGEYFLAFLPGDLEISVKHSAMLCKGLMGDTKASSDLDTRHSSMVNDATKMEVSAHNRNVVRRVFTYDWKATILGIKLSPELS